VNALNVIRYALTDARQEALSKFASDSMLNYFDGKCVGAFHCAMPDKEVEIAAQSATNEIRFLIRKVRGIA
jgi:hypothetical protein